MKKRQHKWFRNERYKLKLERDVDKHKTYYSNVFFITKEVDYEYVQKRWNERWAHWWTDERKWEYLTRKERGKDYYVYYDRPSVPYSIQYYHKSPRRSARQKDLKKRTNRKVRQAFRDKGVIYQNNEYRRIQEFWWELD
jgi:hypothetical protein